MRVSPRVAHKAPSDNLGLLMPTNASITLLLEPPFQWWVYLAATALNLLLGVSGFIGKTIGWCIDAFVSEVALLKKGKSSQQSLQEAIQAAIAEDREDLGAKRPIGRIVGVIERQIYLYALFSPIHGMITAVLLFKAFSGWLKLGDPLDKSGHEADLKVNGETEIKGLRTLARYYSYAIGNFMSLAWALLIFEGLRAALQMSSQLKAILLMDGGSIFGLFVSMVWGSLG
jgi:hypothetical protein